MAWKPYRRGTVERHAVRERRPFRNSLAGTVVLLNTDKVGETDGDILPAFLNDKGLGISLGFSVRQSRDRSFRIKLRETSIGVRSRTRNFGYENVS